MRNWQELYTKIGPLRYQNSSADCVPTTIINALSVLTEAPVSAKLLQLIWGLSLDSRDSGTGYVCCNTLAQLLESWFEYSCRDEPDGGYELPYKSRIIKEDSVNARRDGDLIECLNSGGVACITAAKGAHYVLLHGIEEGRFLGFDSEWNPEISPSLQQQFSLYHGMVNFTWSLQSLRTRLTDDRNKWIHLIHPFDRSESNI